jgi:hypothetical protein
LLAGLNALNNLLAERFRFDALDKIARDLKIDIRFEEREADLAQGLARVGLGNLPQASQVAESVLELAA